MRRGARTAGAEIPHLPVWARCPYGLALLSMLLVSLAAAAGPGGDRHTFRHAMTGYPYAFPHDHGSHDDFRTEWWYYTGHLVTEDGREFGFELTFFRRGIEDMAARNNPSRWAVRHLYLAHAALSDHRGRRFLYAEKVSRAGLGKAGADRARLHVWIDRWAAEALTADHTHHGLHASADQFAFDLTVTPEKDPVVHGTDGLSLKGAEPGQASHYYSLTRLRTTGTVLLDGQSFAVHGVSWMDHEFGSGELGREQVGWDWFSVQLDNGAELMFYRLRRKDGAADPVSSGTLVQADGTPRHLTVSDVQLEALEDWTSPVSGARYPHRWRLSVPSLDLVLQLVPKMSSQELVTRRSTRVTYWEGAVAVHGQIGRTVINGQGYVELTGYAAPLRP